MPAEYESFARRVAALLTDDEMQAERPGDADAGWQNDDAWSTLHHLIEEARALLSSDADSDND